MQLPFAHSPLAEPLTCTFSTARSASMQRCTSPVSTNWPSQKSAPSGCWQRALQPPDSSAVHDASRRAWQSIWHCALASARQLPLQDAWHLPSHVADGGVPLHCASHFAVQFAWQDARQVSPSDELAQRALQSPSHDAVQLPEQSNDPGFAWQRPWQSAWQDPVHSADACTLH